MCVTPAALAAPVAALVRRCGAPVQVVSRDDGDHVTFLEDGATVDTVVDADRDLVRAIDVRAGAPATMTIEVDGTARTFAFGSYAAAQADADLTDVADYAFDAGRAYRLDERRELVLGFDPATQRLARVAIGERLTLSRLGLLPRPLDQPPFPYAAPVLVRTAVPDGTGSQATVVRLDVDAAGVVRTVTIVVPSADAAFDAALAARLGYDRYAPARLGGRPIAASVLRELRH
jgi:hypothetical protein